MNTKLISILAMLSLSAPAGAEPFFITADSLKGVTPQVVEAGEVTTVDAIGFDFWDDEFDSNNVTGSFAIGDPGDIWNGIGWDTVSTSVGDSWGSDMTVGFSADSDLTTKDVVVTVSATEAPVNMEVNSSSGILKFSDLSLPDFSLVDGSVYYELYEDFDDFPDAIDGFWESGSTLSFQVVPEPCALHLLILGGLASHCLHRRRGDWVLCESRAVVSTNPVKLSLFHVAR